MLEEFIKSSPIAESVYVKGNVILHRMKLSTEDLKGIRMNGEFIIKRDKSESYELEINGLTIAAGRIVKKRGEYFILIVTSPGPSGELFRFSGFAAIIL